MERLALQTVAKFEPLRVFCIEHLETPVERKRETMVSNKFPLFLLFKRKIKELTELKRINTQSTHVWGNTEKLGEEMNIQKFFSCQTAWLSFIVCGALTTSFCVLLGLSLWVPPIFPFH
jgi:hypothetical protein